MANPTILPVLKVQADAGMVGGMEGAGRSGAIAAGHSAAAASACSTPAR